MALTAPAPAPRPHKRRRLLPSQSHAVPWPTSQAVLTPSELRAILPPAFKAVHQLSPAHLQIPKGLLPAEWILRSLPGCTASDAASLPQELAELLLPAAATIPACVTATPQLLPLPALRTPVPGAGRVWAVRIKRAATPAATATNIRALLPPAEACLFKGMDLAQRGFLVPVLPAEASAELGAGVYTTPSLELATHLAGVGGRAGAVLVFRVPPVEGLKVWELGREEWRRVVARELGIRKGRGRGALVDVVVGGVSGDAWVAKMERRMPVAEMGLRQAVWRSGEACRRLASALMAVVFLED